MKLYLIVKSGHNTSRDMISQLGMFIVITNDSSYFQTLIIDDHWQKANW